MHHFNFSCELSFSVNVRDDPVGDTTTVGVPGKSIFGPALSLISGLSVNQQDGEVNDVEVGQKM